MQPDLDHDRELQAAPPASELPPPSEMSDPKRPSHTEQQRWYIAASVSVLVAIMVATAFASGVYIGSNREVASGAALLGPRGPLPGGQAAGAPRLGQPPQGRAEGIGPESNGSAPQAPAPPAVGTFADRFELIGTVIGISDSEVEVSTANGSRTIQIDALTRLESQDGRRLALSSLAEGSIVGLVMRNTSATAAELILIAGPGT